MRAPSIFGKTLRILRNRATMSRTELAAEMRRLGYKWAKYMAIKELEEGKAQFPQSSRIKGYVSVFPELGNIRVPAKRALSSNIR